MIVNRSLVFSARVCLSYLKSSTAGINYTTILITIVLIVGQRRIRWKIAQSDC